MLRLGPDGRTGISWSGCSMIPTKLTDHHQSILEKPMGETSQGLPDKSQDGAEEDGIVPPAGIRQTER